MRNQTGTADFTNNLEEFEQLFTPCTFSRSTLMNFKQATLNQLYQILRHENCEIGYKLAAEYELERRARKHGFSLNYFVPYAKSIG